MISDKSRFIFLTLFVTLQLNFADIHGMKRVYSRISNKNSLAKASFINSNGLFTHFASRQSSLRGSLCMKGHRSIVRHSSQEKFRFFEDEMQLPIVVPDVQIATALMASRLSLWLGSVFIAGIAIVCDGEKSSNQKDKDKVSTREAQKNEDNELSSNELSCSKEIETTTSEIPQKYQAITIEEKHAKAKQIKHSIDTILLACLGGNDTWDQNITFAETIDLCLNAIKGHEELIDEFREIFFCNEPESWPKVSSKQAIKLLLEVRDKNSTKEISAILYDLFYLLPESLQKDYLKLGLRVPCRLYKGHPGTKSTYRLNEPFDTKEEELK